MGCESHSFSPQIPERYGVGTCGKKECWLVNGWENAPMLAGFNAPNDSSYFNEGRSSAWYAAGIGYNFRKLLRAFGCADFLLQLRLLSLLSRSSRRPTVQFAP
jgi:hypothetical protein